MMANYRKKIEHDIQSKMYEKMIRLIIYLFIYDLIIR